MNRIIESFLETHKKEYGLDDLKRETAFEHFMNRCIVNKYSTERFDPDIIMTDKGEKGLDGVAILVNEKIITSLGQIDSILTADKTIEAKFVFIQSKTSDSFSASEIGDFIYGIKAFFASKSERPKTNEKMENLIAIKDELYSKSINFSAAPSLELFYACCGKWNVGNGLQARIDIDITPLRQTADFSAVQFYVYDSEKIITTYKELKKKIYRSFLMEKRATFPTIEGVTQAYMGVVKCKDYINILKDSDGNILNNIFEDNVRDFQGYNLVNSEIKKTLYDPKDQARFAILNNGITIVASNIKITGDTVELFDYQIVNGCQSSYVLFDNRDVVTDQSYIVVKIIEVKSEEIADRIIFTTNRQTEVRSEAFTATKIFHKGLQDFYNSVEPAFQLFYERRSKQYDLVDNISKNRVISLTAQITSYISMFLHEPQSTHRYYGELLTAYENKIFLPQDSYEVYYISAYFSYFVDLKFKTLDIPKKLRKFRFHLICGMKCLTVGTQINFGKARPQKKEFEELFLLVKDEIKLEQCLKTSITCLLNALNATTIPVQEQHRSREITIEFLKEISKISDARTNSNFLKKGDIVHCTVVSVDRSFVNVEIKTEDSRNFGAIHISQVATHYIYSLYDEVAIGEIFQAQIISDDFFFSKWGWELTKII